MMKPEVQHVAMELADGHVAMMQFVTRQPPRGGHPGWERDASNANILSEIARAGYEPKQWVKVDPKDIPPDRDRRNLWRLVNGKIVVEEAPAAVESPSPHSSSSLATDMRARASDFDARVKSVLEEAAREMAAAHIGELEARVANLEQRHDNLKGVVAEFHATVKPEGEGA